MRKYLILTLLLLLSLSFTTSARSLDYFYADLVDTTEIEYMPQQGEIEYYLTPLEYNYGRLSEDGIEQEFSINYGLSPNTQLTGNFNYNVNSLYLNLYLKHRFYQNNGWIMAGQLQDYYAHYQSGDSNNIPSLKLITEKRLDASLTLHNNFKLSFYDGGTRKTMENGFSYRFTENHTLKALLTTFFTDYLSNSSTDIEVALKSALSDQFSYTAYIKPGEQYIQLKNLLDYQIRPDLKLSALYEIYTTDLYNNYFTAGISKELDQNLTFNGRYRVELKENGRKELKCGFNYQF